MTDKLYYQDVFTTINIPKPERRLALKAKNLFDSASGVEPWSPNVYAHLLKTVDTKSASQAFWEFDNTDDHSFDRLVLTMMQRGLTIALEHRETHNDQRHIRESLHISRGVSKVFRSETSSHKASHIGSSSEYDIRRFKNDFFETIAHLGLYSHIQEQRIDQNESNSAILANAA